MDINVGHRRGGVTLMTAGTGETCLNRAPGLLSQRPPERFGFRNNAINIF